MGLSNHAFKAFMKHSMLHAIAALVLVNTAFAQGGRPSSEVEVINTPDVNVVNTPGVNVVNTPAVEISNTPTVQIGGEVTVRDRDNPALQPVQFTCEVTVADTDPIEGVLCGGPPIGKRLVIEYLNARAFVPTGQRPDMRLTISGTDLLSANASIEYNLPLTDCGVIGLRTCYAHSEVVKMYHTNFDIVFTLGRSIGPGPTPHAGEARATIHVSGHLVDVP